MKSYWRVRWDFKTAYWAIWKGVNNNRAAEGKDRRYKEEKLRKHVADSLWCYQRDLRHWRKKTKLI